VKAVILRRPSWFLITHALASSRDSSGISLISIASLVPLRLKIHLRRDIPPSEASQIRFAILCRPGWSSSNTGRNRRSQRGFVREDLEPSDIAVPRLILLRVETSRTLALVSIGLFFMERFADVAAVPSHHQKKTRANWRDFVFSERFAGLHSGIPKYAAISFADEKEKLSPLV
jgi:hypothetical protein